MIENTNTDNPLHCLPLDVLNCISPESSWGIGEYVSAACLLEASAPKAGNVHPGARFDDMDYEDFCRSARIISEVFSQSDSASCGSLVLTAVQATRDVIGKNTNLGIVLLLAPMVVASRSFVSTGGSLRDRWSEALAIVLDSLTPVDSSMIYEAISIAKPGGLGRVTQMDVLQSPPENLMTAMRVAAEWDDIAKQYATNFGDVFALSERIDFYHQSERLGWFHTLCIVHAERLAIHGDTLIARKNSPVIVDEVKRLAGLAIQTGSLCETEWTGRPELKRLDDFMRADGHRRNPGTTADLLAAAVLVSLMREYDNIRNCISPTQKI